MAMHKGNKGDIRRWCKAAQITMAEVARRTGVSHDTLRRWNSTGEYPKWASALLIGSLVMPPDYMLHRRRVTPDQALNAYKNITALS